MVTVFLNEKGIEWEMSAHALAKVVCGDTWQGNAQTALSALLEKNWLKIVKTHAKVYVNARLSREDISPAQESWLTRFEEVGYDVVWN